jgi:hypothetical protein
VASADELIRSVRVNRAFRVICRVQQRCGPTASAKVLCVGHLQ